MVAIHISLLLLKWGSDVDVGTVYAAKYARIPVTPLETAFDDVSLSCIRPFDVFVLHFRQCLNNIRVVIVHNHFCFIEMFTRSPKAVTSICQNPYGIEDAEI